MKKVLLHIFSLLLCARVLAAGAQTSVAVLSRDGGAYLEAFSAFQAAYGAEVPHLDASRRAPALPPAARTVAAFGAKAAGREYPPEVNLIYSMAPGFFLDTTNRTGITVKISLRPAPAVLIAGLKKVQPSLKRLAIFWTGTGYSRHLKEIVSAGAATGVVVSTVMVNGTAALPALLRRELPRMDAFWIPPDPALITRESIFLFREFSWANGIPFYGSTKGMAREGAAASIGASFSECGAMAARAVKAIEAGETPPKMIFSQKPDITLNASAARKCGLTLSPEITRETEYMFP